MKREGKDISIITWSREVNFSLEAAAKLAEQGIEAGAGPAHLVLD